MSETVRKRGRKRTAIVIMTVKKRKVLSLDWIWPLLLPIVDSDPVLWVCGFQSGSIAKKSEVERKRVFICWRL